MTAQDNLRLLEEIDANRIFLLEMLRQNPFLLKRAEQRVQQLLLPLSPRPNGLTVNLPANVRGFTIIELVVTLIIVGIMAVVVVPRFDALKGFDARGFRDQTVATLRFAQKTALAQRRAVCVTTSSSGATLEIAATSTVNTGCGGVQLIPPFTAKPGSNLTSTPGSFNFLRMGETDAANDITLQIPDADDIKIDKTTGYVR